MYINEMVNEVIYFCNYFEIVKSDDIALMAEQITRNLENIVFVNNLIDRLREEMQLKRFMTDRTKERLENLLIGLNNTKFLLELENLDNTLVKVNQ